MSSLCQKSWPPNEAAKRQNQQHLTFVAQLLTDKSCAQSELAISILPERAREIRGDHANGLTQKNS